MSSPKIQQKCLLPDDPDLSGPGIRLALTIPVIEVVLISIVWTSLRKRADPETLRKLTTALCHLNALQLSTATVFLAIIWSKQDSSDWLHLQLALNAAALGGWSTSLAAIAMPGWFTKKMFQVPALIGYLCLSVLNIRRFQATISTTDPACLPHHFCIMQPIGMWIGVILVLSLFVYLAIFNLDTIATKTDHGFSRHAMKGWRSRYILLLQMIPIFWIGVGLWVTFYCYSLQKPFLRASEDQWTPGQIFPTCFVVIGSVAELWNIFNMDGIISTFIYRTSLSARDTMQSYITFVGKTLQRCQLPFCKSSKPPASLPFHRSQRNPS